MAGKVFLLREAAGRAEHAASRECTGPRARLARGDARANSSPSRAQSNVRQPPPLLRSRRPSVEVHDLINLLAAPRRRMLTPPLSPFPSPPAAGHVHLGDTPARSNPARGGDAHGSRVHRTRLGRRGGKPCLVLDLDETLVHSSPTVPNADYVIPVEIDPGTLTDVYVLKRPYVDYFMEEMGKHYEIVVFTAAGLARGSAVGSARRTTSFGGLFGESCYPFQGELRQGPDVTGATAGADHHTG